MSDDEKQTPAVESPVEKAPAPREKTPTAGVEVMDDARTRAFAYTTLTLPTTPDA
mgnify:CR=1 FL=1